MDRLELRLSGLEPLGESSYPSSSQCKKQVAAPHETDLNTTIPVREVFLFLL